MKVIVRVQVVTDWGEVSEVDVAEVQRPSREFESKTLGLSLDDGKQIMQRLQQTVASAQTDEFSELQRVCSSCHRWKSHQGLSVAQDRYSVWHGQSEKSENCFMPLGTALVS
jgi:lysyl-tRNA synthetase class I